MLRSIFFIFIFFFTFVSFSQRELLQSGPMVGYSEMREVMLWLQTKKEASVKIIYWDTMDPDKKYETNEVKTTSEDAFTAHLIAGNVEPGRRYNYEVLINNKKLKFNYPLEFQSLKLWQWRSDPPDFTFATGSCAFINEEPYDRPGKPYGGDYHIFESIYKKKPDFMLWLGDNTYLREVDWNSKSGINKRYTHTRSLPELQPLLASVHHYAIWDDHDFGPDNSDGSFTHKDKTLTAFRNFWCNPSYGVNGNGGITSRFEWGDVEFFLLDDRYFRTADKLSGENKAYFGDAQLNWLMSALASSRATFKVIVSGGQILNSVPDKDNYSTFPDEREKFLEMLEEQKITGLLFITGDIHLTEITKLERKKLYPLYEFTLSPLTSGVGKFDEKRNTARLNEYSVKERNFGIFSVKGKKDDRMISLTVYNSNGEPVTAFSVKASELQ